jgi:hypothetical protein
MLKDGMKRAHRAYTRLLANLMPDIERFAHMTKDCLFAVILDAKPGPISEP